MLEDTYVKIEFGSGKKIKSGFISSDIRSLPNVKHVCNCWEIDQHVSENSIEEIYSRHMFEHLTFKQGRMALRSWYKILQKNGKVNLILPDLKYHIQEYINYYDNRETSHFPFPSFLHSVGSIFGWQTEKEQSDHFTASQDLWDVHKSGYDERSLRELVESCGYINFERQPNPKGPWHLEVIFFKE